MLKHSIAMYFLVAVLLPVSCLAQFSDCQLRLTNAQFRLFSKSEEAMNAKWEDAGRYVTDDLRAYAAKAAWQDYQTEVRLASDKICRAEWLTFIFTFHPSILNKATVPIVPETTLAAVNEALTICKSRPKSDSSCKELKKRGAVRRLKANFLAVEMLEVSSGEDFRFRLTNRSKTTAVHSIYIPLVMEDKKHLMQQKQAEIFLDTLSPGESKIVTMKEVPGWKDAIEEFYKVNNIREDAHVSAAIETVGFKLGAQAQPESYPFEWFGGTN